MLNFKTGDVITVSSLTNLFKDTDYLIIEYYNDNDETFYNLLDLNISSIPYPLSKFKCTEDIKRELLNTNSKIIKVISLKEYF